MNIKLSKDTLKLIAIIAMTIDHILWLIFPYNKSLFCFHIIGRITLPIMCFFIAEGYIHTKNLKKYFGRMVIFTIISHFAYNFAFNIPYIPFKNGFLDQTSVMLALTLSIAFIYVKESKIRYIYKFPILIIILIMSIPSDYMFVPILITYCMYKYMNNREKFIKSFIYIQLIYSIYLILFRYIPLGTIQIFSICALVLLKLYDNTKKSKLKYFFYLYYPIHLILIGMIAKLF